MLAVRKVQAICDTYIIIFRGNEILQYFTSVKESDIKKKKPRTFFFFMILQSKYLNYASTAAAAAKSLQSCPTLCDPIDGSPPGSSISGILQAKILEWVVISFSNACMHTKSLQSCPTLCDPIDSSTSFISVILK